MRPSSLLGIYPTEPRALLVDLTVAHLARKWEIEEGSGDYWWLGILRAFTGNSGSSDSAAGQPTVDPKNVRWM